MVNTSDSRDMTIKKREEETVTKIQRQKILCDVDGLAIENPKIELSCGSSD